MSGDATTTAIAAATGRGRKAHHTQSQPAHAQQTSAHTIGAHGARQSQAAHMAEAASLAPASSPAVAASAAAAAAAPRTSRWQVAASQPAASNAPAAAVSEASSSLPAPQAAPLGKRKKSKKRPPQSMNVGNSGPPSLGRGSSADSDGSNQSAGSGHSRHHERVNAAHRSPPTHPHHLPRGAAGMPSAASASSLQQLSASGSAVARPSPSPSPALSTASSGSGNGLRPPITAFAAVKSVAEAQAALDAADRSSSSSIDPSQRIRHKRGASEHVLPRSQQRQSPSHSVSHSPAPSPRVAPYQQNSALMETTQPAGGGPSTAPTPAAAAAVAAVPRANGVSAVADTRRPRAQSAAQPSKRAVGMGVFTSALAQLTQQDHQRRGHANAAPHTQERHHAHPHVGASSASASATSAAAAASAVPSAAPAPASAAASSHANLPPVPTAVLIPPTVAPSFLAVASTNSPPRAEQRSLPTNTRKGKASYAAVVTPPAAPASSASAATGNTSGGSTPLSDLQRGASWSSTVSGSISSPELPAAVATAPPPALPQPKEAGTGGGGGGTASPSRRSIDKSGLAAITSLLTSGTRKHSSRVGSKTASGASTPNDATPHASSSSSFSYAAATSAAAAAAAAAVDVNAQRPKAHARGSSSDLSSAALNGIVRESTPPHAHAVRPVPKPAAFSAAAPSPPRHAQLHSSSPQAFASYTNERPPSNGAPGSAFKSASTPSQPPSLVHGVSEPLVSSRTGQMMSASSRSSSRMTTPFHEHLDAHGGDSGGGIGGGGGGGGRGGEGSGAHLSSPEYSERASPTRTTPPSVPRTRSAPSSPADKNHHAARKSMALEAKRRERAAMHAMQHAELHPDQHDLEESVGDDVVQEPLGLQRSSSSPNLHSQSDSSARMLRYSYPSSFRSLNSSFGQRGGGSAGAVGHRQRHHRRPRSEDGSVHSEAEEGDAAGDFDSAAEEEEEDVHAHSRSIDDVETEEPQSDIRSIDDEEEAEEEEHKLQQLQKERRSGGGKSLRLSADSRASEHTTISLASSANSSLSDAHLPRSNSASPSLHSAVQATAASATTAVAPVPPPAAAAAAVKPFSELHNLITGIAQLVGPNSEQDQQRSAVIRRMSEAVHALWPTAEVHVIGSCATRLFLIDSDIDMVVRPAPDAPPLGVGELFELGQHLTPLSRSINIISTASVPLIKLEDKETGLTVDFTLNVDTGLLSTDFVLQQLQQFPGLLHPLTIVLKTYLKKSCLNDLFTGGLPSYSLVLLIISFLQQHTPEKRDERHRKAQQLQQKLTTPTAHAHSHRKQQTGAESVASAGAAPLLPTPSPSPPLPVIAPSPHILDPAHPDLGEYLLAFLHLYGFSFPYHQLGISLHSGYFLKAQRSWLHAHNPHLLCLENPRDPTNDLGYKVFKFQEIRALFVECYTALVKSANVQQAQALAMAQAQALATANGTHIIGTVVGLEGQQTEAVFMAQQQQQQALLQQQQQQQQHQQQHHHHQLAHHSSQPHPAPYRASSTLHFGPQGGGGGGATPSANFYAGSAYAQSASAPHSTRHSPFMAHQASMPGGGGAGAVPHMTLQHGAALQYVHQSPSYANYSQHATANVYNSGSSIVGPASRGSPSFGGGGGGGGGYAPSADGDPLLQHPLLHNGAMQQPHHLQQQQPPQSQSNNNNRGSGKSKRGKMPKNGQHQPQQQQQQQLQLQPPPPVPVVQQHHQAAAR